MKRVTGRYGADLKKTFASEDGKHYRGISQDVDAIKAHIRRRDDMVNGAPSRGNPGEWAYAGSIPITLLVEWLSKTGMRMDQYARNEDNARKKFLAWLRVEHPQLLPKPAAAARPKIAVPETYRKRAEQ